MQTKKAIATALAVLTIAGSVPAISFITDDTTMTVHAATVEDYNDKTISGCPDGTRQTASYSGAKISYIISNNKVYIYRVKTDRDYITIPATIGGKPVVYIDAAALSTNSTVKKVTFNNTEKLYIHAEAFNAYKGIKTGYATTSHVTNLVFNGPFSICTVEKNADNRYIPANLRLSSVKTINFGQKVTSIPSISFARCTSLTAIYAPYVSSIGRQAFAMCSSLKTVSVPRIRKIQDDAFALCYNMTETTMNKLLKSAGTLTIFNAKYKDTYVPASIQNANYAKFAKGTIKVQSYSDGRTMISAQTDKEVMILHMGQKVKDGPAEYIIPSRVNDKTVSYIAYDAINNDYISSRKIKINTKDAVIEGFNNLKVTDINLSSMKVGPYTYLTNLKTNTISMPDTLKAIPSYMFANTYIGYGQPTTLNLKNTEIINQYAFRYANINATVTGPKVKTIKNKSFYYCNKLTNAYFENCSKIGDYAFAHATYLEKLIVTPNTIVSDTALKDTNAKLVRR